MVMMKVCAKCGEHVFDTQGRCVECGSRRTVMSWWLHVDVYAVIVLLALISLFVLAFGKLNESGAF